MGVQGQNWIMDILRVIFCFLDRLVYGLIKWILYGIFDLSSLTANSDVFSGINRRIYVILGIFMAFKLSFSFFQYLIDPESMIGKGDKSVSKLFTRVFIMLFALMVLPTILFGGTDPNGTKYKGMLERAQDVFLPVLPKLIFGAENFGSSGGVDGTVGQAADEMSIVALRGFFSPSEELDDVCGDGTYDSVPEIETLEDFENNIKLTCDARGTGVLGIGSKQYYKYSYLPFVSTIVGVLIAALLLGITIDIAKRIFKLIILEVIAPVPIMSLIDPKGAKDGAFSHWIKSLTTTFLDIFIKLGLVYIVLVFIHLIVNVNEKGGLFANFPKFEAGSRLRFTYLTILLIIGLIFFAKEAPKFIKDSLGMKDSGGSLFDDVKSVGKAAGIVGGGALGLVGSGIAAGRASYLSDEANGKKHNLIRGAKNIGAGLIGGITGGLSSASAAYNAKDHSFRAATDNIRKRNELALSRGAAGSTLFGRVGTNVRRTLIGDTAADSEDRKIARLEGLSAAGEALHSYLEDRAVKKGSGYTVSAKRDGGATFDTTYNAFSSAMLQAKQTGASTFTVDGQSFETFGAETARIEGDLKTAAADKWASEQLNLDSSARDETFEDLRVAYIDSGGNAANVNNANNLKGEFKSSSRKAKNMKSSSKYGRYKANANASKK